MSKTDLKADSSWLSVPFLKQLDEIKYIHVVRDPIDVIKSFIELDLFNDKNFGTSPYVNLINNYCNLKYDNHIDRVISYYITWFKMIESYDIDKIIINLENVDYNKLSEFLNTSIEPLDKKVNTKTDKKNKTINRDELLKKVKDSVMYSELCEISEKYGYEI
jgi:hypothetical protein